MSKFRTWLINLLIGDSSYIRNCVIDGSVGLRNSHCVNGCTFFKGAYVYVGDRTNPKSRFPEILD